MMPRKIREDCVNRTVKSLGPNVAYNPLIVENIFKHVGDKDLLHIRLVTKLWRTLATKILREDRNLHVSVSTPLHLSVLGSLITRSFPAVIHEWDLEKLMNPAPDAMEKLGLSKETYPTYLYENVIQLSSKTAKFAKGCRVCYAGKYFLIDNGLTREFALFNILVRDYAHVEELDLENFLLLGYDVVSAYDAVALPNVKRLKLPQFLLPRHHDFLKQVIRDSPKLENLEIKKLGWRSREVQLILDCEKTACVTQFEIRTSFFMIEDLQVLINFVQHRPALRFFKMSEREGIVYSLQELEQLRMVWEVLRCLCTDASSKLESMTVPDLTFLFGHDDGAIKGGSAMPIFRKVMFLKLKNRRWSTSSTYHRVETCILPQTLSPALCFPSLTEVELSFGDGCVEQNLKLASISDMRNGQLVQFSTVKKLKVKCAYGENDLEILPVIFPHIKDLTYVQVVGRSLRLPKELARFPDLESLTTIYYFSRQGIDAEEILSKFLTDLGRSELDQLAADYTAHGNPRVKNSKFLLEERPTLRGYCNSNPGWTFFSMRDEDYHPWYL